MIKTNGASPQKSLASPSGRVLSADIGEKPKQTVLKATPLYSGKKRDREPLASTSASASGSQQQQFYPAPSIPSASSTSTNENVNITTVAQSSINAEMQMAGIPTESPSKKSKTSHSVDNRFSQYLGTASSQNILNARIKTEHGMLQPPCISVSEKPVVRPFRLAPTAVSIYPAPNAKASASASTTHLAAAAPTVAVDLLLDSTVSRGQFQLVPPDTGVFGASGSGSAVSATALLLAQTTSNDDLQLVRSDKGGLEPSGSASAASATSPFHPPEALSTPPRSRPLTTSAIPAQPTKFRVIDATSSKFPLVRMAATFRTHFAAFDLDHCGSGNTMVVYRTTGPIFRGEAVYNDIAIDLDFEAEFAYHEIVLKFINQERLLEINNGSKEKEIVKVIFKDLEQYDKMKAAGISLAEIRNRDFVVDHHGYVVQRFVPHDMLSDLTLWLNKPTLKVSDLPDPVQKRLAQIQDAVVKAVRNQISMDSRPANFRYDDKNTVYNCDPGQDWDSDDTPLFYVGEGLRLWAKGSTSPRELVPINLNIVEYLINPLKDSDPASYKALIEQVKGYPDTGS
jgi:hypothetical protein